MSRKTFRDHLYEARVDQVIKDERKALKKQRSSTIILKVYRRDFPLFQERGWEIVSSTPNTHLTIASFLMSIDRSVLEARHAS